MASADVVGPYTGRVVAPADAARTVIPMPASGDRPRSAAPAPGAAKTSGPAFYRYRQRTPDGMHTGLVCDVDLAAFAVGRVRPHEEVRPDRVEALVEHLAAGSGSLELVTTLHDAGPLFTAALSRDLDEPEVGVRTEDGVVHAVWRLADDAGLAHEMSRVPHYLADGHHRVAASLALWERAGRPPGARLGVAAYALDGLRLGPHENAVEQHRRVPSLAEILALADSGRTVRPKTTRFRPKPASGLFVARA